MQNRDEEIEKTRKFISAAVELAEHRQNRRLRQLLLLVVEILDQIETERNPSGTPNPLGAWELP